MFTIEHTFDATVITLIDEGQPVLHDDVAVHAFDDQVVVEQADPDTGDVARVVLSMTQLRDLAAAMNLPEGSYRLTRKT